MIYALSSALIFLCGNFRNMTKDRNGFGCYPADGRIAESGKYIRQINKLNGDTRLSGKDLNDGNVVFMLLIFAEYGIHKTYPYKIKRYANFQ